MSRRRSHTSLQPNQFRITCTDRGQHNSIEIVVLTDNRHSPTDERFREIHDALGHLSPEPVDDPVKNMAPEHVRRSIQQIKSSFRFTTSNRAFTLDRAMRFEEVPGGGVKLRLECDRCGRDEQLSPDRLDKLGDVMTRANRRQRNGVDMSYLPDYLGAQ